MSKWPWFCKKCNQDAKPINLPWRGSGDLCDVCYTPLSEATPPTAQSEIDRLRAENAELLKLVETSNKLVDELKAKLKRACDGMRMICFDFLNTATGELEPNKEHYLWKLADELEKP